MKENKSSKMNLIPVKDGERGFVVSSETTNASSATSSSATTKDGTIDVGYGKIHVKGEKNDVIISLGIGAAIIASIGGLYYCCKKWSDTKAKKEASSDRITENNIKSTNRIEEHHEASKDRMAEDDNRTDNRIRLEQAKADIRREERAERASFRTGVMPSAIAPITKDSLGSAIRAIHSKVGNMPDCSAIPFLDTLIEGCPDGYEDAMILSLLSALGALSFSKVRAQYLDGKNHSPSLQTIIEGAHGAGKGKVQHLYEVLFSRAIESDAAKLKLGEEERPIIQTAGINITASRYFDIIAANKGVHTYAMETEIQAVTDRFKKKGGLSPDYLRKALYNESIYQNSKTSGAATGSFPVFFNYTFTGTPNAVANLITPNEVEGGTAARICFSAVPEIGKEIPNLTLPDGDELEALRDQIDAWRKRYCFKTVNGCDIPCSETIIDLSYINDALKTWLGKQYDLAQSEGCDTRNAERARMATIAFHAAIVLHMLAGNPGPEEKQARRTVKKLTLYIADICMERYLQKYAWMEVKGETRSVVIDGSCEEQQSSPVLRKHITKEEVAYWYPLRGTLDENGKELGLGTIAKRLGADKDTVRNAFKRYEKTLNRRAA